MGMRVAIDGGKSKQVGRHLCCPVSYLLLLGWLGLLLLCRGGGGLGDVLLHHHTDTYT